MENDKAKVALVRGDHRYQNVREALRLIEDTVDLTARKLVLVKVNFVSTSRQLAATHRDAVRAVLDFVRERYDGPLAIAEGAALSDTFEGFRNFGYMPLAEEYDASLVDLNQDEGVRVELLDRHLRPMEVEVARTVVESDFRIVVGPPKTHDTVIVTLSLKNIAVGSLIRRRGRNYKVAIHQGYPAINLNLYRLARVLAPHLAVLDGFEAMEGSGPTAGSAVAWRIAVASADFLAADALTAHLMGFDVKDIGYLYYCQLKGMGVGDLERMEIVGNVSPAEVRRRFRPHPGYREQLRWRIPDAERYL